MDKKLQTLRKEVRAKVKSKNLKQQLSPSNQEWLHHFHVLNILLFLKALCASAAYQPFGKPTAPGTYGHCYIPRKTFLATQLESKNTAM